MQDQRPQRGQGARQGAGVSGRASYSSDEGCYGYSDEEGDDDMDMETDADAEQDDEQGAEHARPQRRGLGAKRKQTHQQQMYGRKSTGKRLHYSCNTSRGAWSPPDIPASQFSDNNSAATEDKDWALGQQRRQAPPPGAVRHSLRLRDAACREGHERICSSSVSTSLTSFGPRKATLRQPSPPHPYKDDIFTPQKCTSQKRALTNLATAKAREVAQAGAVNSDGDGCDCENEAGPSMSRRGASNSGRTTKPRATTVKRPIPKPSLPLESSSDEHGANGDDDRPPRSLFDLMAKQRQNSKFTHRKMGRNTWANKLASANAVCIKRRGWSALQIFSLVHLLHFTLVHHPYVSGSDRSTMKSLASKLPSSMLLVPPTKPRRRRGTLSWSCPLAALVLNRPPCPSTPSTILPHCKAPDRR